jgi:hypothetical protein
MPPPEILRRCAVCGAASRPGALFCQQCGNATAGMRAEPDAGDADDQDRQGLDPRLQTRKLDSAEPDLQTRRLDEGQQQPRSRADTTILMSEGVDESPTATQTLDTLKSALQSSLAEKTALLEQGRDDEASELDSEIEANRQALEAASQNIMSPVARDSEVDAGVGDVGSPDSYANVAGDKVTEALDSRINADGAISSPPDAISSPPDALEERIQSGGRKLGKGSSVGLVEAVYDPSVRFVLVAAILFVLFLVIMVLSKIIT